MVRLVFTYLLKNIANIQEQQAFEADQNADIFCLRSRTMKCRELSETRFHKVSRQTEQSLKGKQPFEV